MTRVTGYAKEPEHEEGAEFTEDFTDKLTFHMVVGDVVQVQATVGSSTDQAPAFLTARRLCLMDGTELRQLLVDGTARKKSYERLDNEILAGLRLARAAAGAAYPPEVSRLCGYDPTSAEPFALLEPYRGETLTEVGQQLLPDDHHQFQVSLLNGLCWLATAGIAHRGIGPSTVRWDGRQVQITDFSQATVIGAPRTVIGALPWAAPEQRDDHFSGEVSGKDDIWAAGRLIFYVRTGEELTDRGQLADWPALENLLDGVFGPPEGRPSASEMLFSRLGEPSPIPRGPGIDKRLEEGRQRFYALRARKHPHTLPDEQAWTASGPPSAGADPDPAQADETRAARRAARRFPWRAGGTATMLASAGTWLFR
jgi:serine/threonine protein kinase